MSMNDAPLTDPERLDEATRRRRHDWGVHPGPWVWSQKLKILYVIDGDITPVVDDYFALGRLTQLLDPSFAWWVDFEVTVAQRSPAPFPRPAEEIPLSSPGPYEVTYEHFRFDQSGFDLDAYDQVWLFGFWPGNDFGADDHIERPENTPLTDAELKVLAEWMDAGGGVFATGDHDYMGASMCSRVPRVRTMRKWTHAQGVPPMLNANRHDTNQPANDWERLSLAWMDFDHQGDAVPQPIEVVLDPLPGWIPAFAPHPILCTRGGIIDRFPDHPHEGEVIADDEVRLDDPLFIAGYANPEYPGGRRRPRPKVIAYGRTTSYQINRDKNAVNPKRFGLVGVYDGDPVGIGRVVVDSTWHHWMTENLVGFDADNPEMTTLMAAYYRNVALWLATPVQRAGMLMAATWGVLMGASRMQFPPATPIWELGQRARDVIGRTATQCTIREWIKDVLDTRAFEGIETDPGIPSPPEDVIAQAVLGGMAKGMLEVAFPYQEQMARGERPVPDPDEIAAAARKGAQLGHQELVRMFEAGAAVHTELASRAAEAYREPSIPAPDLRVTPVRVVVDEIRLADLLDPALADDRATLHLRLEVDGRAVARMTIDDIEVPEPGPRGAVLRLGADLAEVTVWLGSQLSVIVSAEVSSGAQATVEDRGSLTLAGDPRTWPGVHRSGIDPEHRWSVQVTISEAATDAE
jgi:hypothetical protein